MTTLGSLYIYANAGVVRDVPEIEVVKGKVHRGMWAEYFRKKERFAKTAVVFLSTLGLNEALIEDVQMLCKGKTKLFLIGEKNFGENNGQVYRHRFAKDYHHLTIEM